jgi:hypothetical protein
VQAVAQRHPKVGIELVEAVGENDVILDAIAAACVANLPQ